MRTVISNREQTDAIRNRRRFGTRKMGNGYVYESITEPDGTYHVWHWNTEIATFYPDGTVWLEDDHHSVTTSAFRQRILHAMSPAERRSAARSIILDMRAYADRYGARYRTMDIHSNKAWRDRLARWEAVYYTPETVEEWGR